MNKICITQMTNSTQSPNVRFRFHLCLILQKRGYYFFLVSDIATNEIRPVTDNSPGTNFLKISTPVKS